MPPLRPFPFPNLTIGTDICRICRVRNIVNGSFQNGTSKLPRFITRVLTHREQVALHEKFPSAVGYDAIPHSTAKQDAALKEQGGQAVGVDDEKGESIARYLAGRWAAKEAVVKACTWRRLTFDQIQILQSTSGPSVYGVILDKASPRVPSELTNPPNPDLGVEDGQSGQIVKVSISHDGEYATAVCLAVEEPGEKDVGGEAAAREL